MANQQKILCPLSMLSMLISRLLARKTVNSSGLQVTKYMTNLEEYILRQLKSENGLYMLQTGSYVELLLTHDSDGDMMYVTTTVTAKTRSCLHELDKTNFELLMDMEGVRPGFSKLKLHSNTNVTELENLPSVIRCSFINTEDELHYISSEKWREDFVKMSESLQYKSNTMVTHHGPCTAIEIKIPPMTWTASYDAARAIECNAWPDEAMEWVSRPRQKGWPSEDQIIQLKEMPCYLLAVGDPTSKDCHLEWRFAFVPTERELIWSFNDTQIQSLLLLKNIKKEFSESLAPDQLSSFHLKTIIFWESEKQGLDMWSDENLINCVRHCLETLIESIKSRELSHYIYRKRNLLYNKFTDEEEQTAVLQKINELNHNLLETVCLLLGSDLLVERAKYRRLLNHPTLTARFMMDMSEMVFEENDLEIKHLRFDLIFCGLGNLIVNEKCLDLMNDLQQNKLCLEAADLNIILSLLSICIGNAWLSCAYHTEDINTKKDLTESASLNFQNGRSLDSTAGPLYQATFFYACKENKKALKIISQVCSISNKETSYHIGHSTFSGPLQPSDKRCEGSHWSSVARDVIFRTSDADFVPYGVKFEFALDSLKPASIPLEHAHASFFHPLVYAYYLYFQICLDMNNKDGCSKAIKKLENFLNMMPSDRFSHWTLNLLAFCFYKYGRYADAIFCLTKSVKCFKDKWNTAALYLWYIFLDMEISDFKENTSELKS